MKAQFRKGDKVSYQVELPYGKGQAEVSATVIAVRVLTGRVEYWLDNGKVFSL